MKIDFCFQGWVRGLEITHVWDATGKSIDVTKIKPATVLYKLNQGKYHISLAAALENASDTEIDLTDFD